MATNSIQTSPDGETGLAERLADLVDEAARLTGLSRDRLTEQRRAGICPDVKVGKTRLITRQHQESFWNLP